MRPRWNPIGRAICLTIFVAGAMAGVPRVRATSGDAVDRVDFGNVTSEALHRFMPGTAPENFAPAGTGAYGLSFRAPVGSGNNLPAGTQVLTFTMGCDPARQNYLSVKLWGNDANCQMYLYNTSNPAIDNSGGPPAFPNRFFYYTTPIPLAWTQGSTSVQVTLLFVSSYDYYFGTGTNYLALGQTTRPIYSAFTHTAPCFVPDSGDEVGSAPARTGQATLGTLTKAQAVAILQAERTSVFSGSSSLYTTMLSRQVPSGTSGAPPEVIGLDLYTPVTTYTAANASATPDQWRNQIANQAPQPGYCPVPDLMLGVLSTAYVLPPFTDANGNTVSGLDHYHDATLIPKIVAAVDGCTYMQDSDGGFMQQGSEWTGLTSTARTTGSYIGSTARQATVHGGGDLQGPNTCAIGSAIITLLNDSSGNAALSTYLAQSFDADLNGGTMLRAYAWERMLFNAVNFYADNCGGVESQNMFQMLGLYASSIALDRLQALYPNSSYIVSPSTYKKDSTTGVSFLGNASPLQAAEMVMGIYPDSMRGVGTDGAVPFTTSPITNYGMTRQGIGEPGGVLSTGFDGEYGQFTAWLGVRFAQLAAWDPKVDAATLASFKTQAGAAINSFDQFLAPADNATTSNGTLTADSFIIAQEDFISLRKPYNINEQGNSWDLNTQILAADPAGPLANPYALRSLYLATQYGYTTPSTASASGDGLPQGSLNNLRDLPAYESAIRSLINVSPATLTPLPAETGQPDFAFADVQCGAVAFVNNGERFYMNANWNNVTSHGGTFTGLVPSQIARVHYTTATTDRGAQIILPYNAATVQPDGNLSSTSMLSAYVVRYGNYLVSLNNGTAATTVALPSGYGQARDLLSGISYNLGTTVSVAAGKATVFWLTASGAPTQGSGSAPTVATAASASTATVTGSSVNLNVLGADDGGESSLTYTWSLTGNPPGPVTFSANGTNAAKTTTATFPAAGAYSFVVLIKDAGGSTTSSSVTVNVSQTLASLGVGPASVTLLPGQTQAFFGGSYDQFGEPFKTAQPLSWTVLSGAGTVDALGNYTAPTAGGSAVVRVASSTFTATAAVTVLPPVGTLSATGDIGSPTAAGTAAYNSSSAAYTLTARSADVYGTSDQFRFAGGTLTGDGTVTARVVSSTNSNVNAKAGVMLRNTLDANSAYAFMFMTPTTTNGASFQYRSAAGGSTATSATTTGITAPYWVRIVRSGNVFTGYRSADGVIWTLQGTVTVAMNQTAYVGLALTSDSTSTTNTSVFDNVSITPAVYTFPNNQNVGSYLSGTYAESAGTITLTGTGGDISSTGDSFQFASTAVDGDATLTARVVSISGVSTTAKVGVMIRGTLNAGSVEAATLLTPSKVLRASVRAAANGTATETTATGTGYVAPYWVRIVRSGSSYSSYTAPDASGTPGAWTQLGSTATVTSTSTMRVGLAVASLNSSSATTAVFDHVTLTGITNTAPTVATQAVIGTLSNSNTATLSVLGADTTGGESNLTYNWFVLGLPPAPVTFAASGTNGAKNTTATFSAPGTYYLRVDIIDSGGLVVASNVVSIAVGIITPSGVTGSAGSNSVSLAWNPATGATGYNVKRATVSGGPYTTLASVVGASYVDATITAGLNYFYVISSTAAGVESVDSVELEVVNSAATITTFSPYVGSILLAPAGSLGYTNASGTAAASVQRANGLTVNGGPLGGTKSRTLQITGAATNTNDSFGPLTLASGAFFGGIKANASANAALTFASIIRAPGTQLCFYDLDTAALGTTTTASATANSANIIFSTAPTLVGGGGASGSPTISILPYTYVGSGLGTYDDSYGLRVLTSAETTTLLASGMTGTSNASVAANTSVSANESVNSLTATGTSTVSLGGHTLSVVSGAIAAKQSLVVGAGANDGVLAFGGVEGNLFVANNRLLTINSIVTGSGGLTASIDDGNGTNSKLILAGANTFTGTTTILGNSPGLQACLTNSLALENSTLDYNNYGATVVFGNGTTTGLTAYTFGGLKGAQNLTLANNNTTTQPVALTVGGDGEDTVYSGSFLNGTGTAAGGSLIKAGTGTLTLAGAHTYTGSTTVNQGTLSLTGSLAAGSAVTVNSGGVLGGTGTVNGPTTVAPGGALSPGTGSGPGTLTFAGALSLKAGSSLNFDLSAAGSDKIALGGTYTAPTGGTATVNINNLTGFGAGTYSLITGATGIAAGSFTLGSAPAGYLYGFNVSGSTLQLVVTLPSIPAAPTGVTATAGNGQVTLAWASVTGATSYNVKRSTVSGGSYVTIATNVATTSYVDGSPTNGTTYYYVVSAANPAGESANSSPVSARPTAPISSSEQSAPLIAYSSSGGSNAVAVTIGTSVVGHTYQLQSCTSLMAGDWQNLGSPQAGSGAALQFSATIDATLPACFFRLLITN